MMVPIALSIVNLSLERRTGMGLSAHGGIPQDDIDDRNLALSLLLGVAYAASIGGLGTLIGSPPNGIFARFVEQTYGIQVSFTRWMLIGVPAMLLFLPLAWWLNTRVLFPTRLSEIEGGRAWVESELASDRSTAANEPRSPCLRSLSFSGCSGPYSPASSSMASLPWPTSRTR